METLTLKNTTDFTVFKELKLNRNVGRTQVVKLAKLIKNNPLLTYQVPILVNEKGEVVDGQHRLAAHQYLADKENLIIPIYYYTRIGLGIMDARTMNSGMKIWKAEDYARVLAGTGNKDYQVYLKVFNDKSLNHDTIARYMCGYNIKGGDFREGKFKVKDLDLALTQLNQLEDIGQVIEAERIGDINFWQHRSFTGAVHLVLTAPNYNHDRMLDQIEKHGHWLRPLKMKTMTLLSTLKKIYNKGTPDKLIIENKMLKNFERNNK